MRGATRWDIQPHYQRFHFNPRAPCGARPTNSDTFKRDFIFQSTRPMRGATLTHGESYELINISIHAPLAGRDQHRQA